MAIAVGALLMLAAAGGIAAVVMARMRPAPTWADPYRCKEALRQQLHETMAARGWPSPAPSAPLACNGLDDELVRRLAAEVVTESVEG